MKVLKGIYKLICMIIIVGVIFTFRNSNINMVTKNSNNNINKNVNLNAMAKVIKNFAIADINTVLDTYNGKLTGYVADCPLCTGYLACNNQNVLDRTTTYYDNTYGTVRILASSLSMPCGSIVRFKNSRVQDGDITAIVLDRGVTGTALDLLVETEEYAIKTVGNSVVEYDILRFGWERQEI